VNISIHIDTIPANIRSRLWVLRHDFECDDANFTAFLPRTFGHEEGLPETEKCINSEFEKLTPEWQFFWFGLLEHNADETMTHDELIKRWQDLTHGMKAFTNKHGSEQYADYVSGNNLDKDPMSQENVTTCGNLVLAVNNTVVTRNGLPAIEVETLDRLKPPPTIEDAISTPWFVHTATICRPEPVDPTPRPDAPNGTFSVIQFPQLNGKDVPVPFVTRGGRNFIYLRRLKKLTGAVPSPYVRA
jgi:hypothetical protein